MIKDQGGSFLGEKSRPLYAGSKNKEIAKLGTVLFFRNAFVLTMFLIE
jgi:hypothetical protein